jgi:hypothetical protein
MLQVHFLHRFVFVCMNKITYMYERSPECSSGSESQSSWAWKLEYVVSGLFFPNLSLRDESNKMEERNAANTSDAKHWRILWLA